MPPDPPGGAAVWFNYIDLVAPVSKTQADNSCKIQHIDFSGLQKGCWYLWPRDRLHSPPEFESLWAEDWPRSCEVAHTADTAS